MASAKKTAVTAFAYICVSASLLLPLLSFSATPVAVWDFTADGMGLDTTQGGIAISAGRGNSFSNGKLVIANSDVYSGGSIALPSGLSKASVLVKYSNFSGFSDHEMYNGDNFYAPVFMSVEDSDGYVLGISATNNAAKFLWNWRTKLGYHDNVLTRHFVDGPALPSSSGYALFSYENSRGMRLCLGTSLSSMTTAEKQDYKFSNHTLVNIGLGGEATSDYADGWPNLVIEKVALFTDEFLSAEDIEDFKFPTLSVGEINAQHGSASEITVNLDDGDIVVGDTTFTATKVNFVCNGSFTLKPPAGNTATFDFSGVTGKPVILYEGALPAQSGDTFTSNTVPAYVADSAKWTGTIWLRNIDVTDFNVNPYGNASSLVRLTGISGWLSTAAAPNENSTYTNSVPVELSNEGTTRGYALRIGNGNSPKSNLPLRATAFVKITGNGKLYDYTWATPVIKIFDLSEFTGEISLTYGTCVVVCDPTTTYTSFYDMFHSHPGSLRIESGKSVTVASDKTWTVKNVHSDGILSGTGRISVSNDQIPSGNSFAGSAWQGTLAISGCATASPLNIHLLGNAGSTVEMSSIGATTAFLAGGTMAGKVVLTDSGDTPALVLNDGISTNCTTFCELAGTGTLSQSKDGIYQGLTINVMTNFTGTLALNKMTVTFGTASRVGNLPGNTGATEFRSGLYIDPDAVLSVPVGFSLWSPVKMVIDGPVNFTTNGDVSEGMVLFDNMGSAVSYGENFNRRTSVSINGVPVEQLGYYVVRRNGKLLTQKNRGFAIRLD